MKALSEFNTLAEAKAYTITRAEIFSASTMRIYLKECGLYLFLQDLYEGKFDSNGVHHPAKEDVCMLFESLKAPNADGQDFNFIQFKSDGATPNNFGQGNIDALNTMIEMTLTEKAAELTALRGMCIARSNIVEYPYKDITDAEYRYKYNMGNKLYTSRVIENWGGQDVTIELLDDLPMQCAVTSWITESGFQTENSGRSKQIQAIGKYRLNMSGVRLRGDLELRIPFENVNFTVSV